MENTSKTTQMECPWHAMACHAMPCLAMPCHFLKQGALVRGIAPQGRFFVCKKTTLFQSRAPVRGIASRGHFCFSKNDPFSLLDITFRVNVAKPPCPPTKYSLSEPIPVIRIIRGIRGNGPNRACPDLCSTHSGGKDDGSSH